MSAPGIRDIVGWYLASPEEALVRGVDEKSQIQALDRSAPVLPMMSALPERRTHDPKPFTWTKAADKSSKT